MADLMEVVNQEFRDLDRRLDERFEVVDQEIKMINTRIDNLETKIDERFDTLLAEIRTVNARLQLMGSLFDHHENRLTKIEDRLSQLEKQPA